MPLIGLHTNVCSFVPIGEKHHENDDHRQSGGDQTRALTPLLYPGHPPTGIRRPA